MHLNLHRIKEVRSKHAEIRLKISNLKWHMKKIVETILKMLFTHLNRFELRLADLGLVTFGNDCVLVKILEQFM